VSILLGTTSILQLYKNSLLGASLGFRPSYRPWLDNFLIFPPFYLNAPQALAQWKTRTHIQKYVYDISSQVLTTIYVSSYFYICVLVLLNLCPHTTMCVLIFVDIHARTSVLVELHARPHISREIQERARRSTCTSPRRYYYIVSSYYDMCLHTATSVSFLAGSSIHVSSFEYVSSYSSYW
jgi:hypothetical protein